MTEYEGHTAGPWRCHISTTSIHGGQSRVDGFSIVGSEGAFKTLICRGADHLEEEQTTANARLIAAAPTLLAERDEARAQLYTARAATEVLSVGFNAACAQRDAIDNADRQVHSTSAELCDGFHARAKNERATGGGE